MIGSPSFGLSVTKFFSGIYLFYVSPFHVLSLSDETN